jgi:hypothetical protein
LPRQHLVRSLRKRTAATKHRRRGRQRLGSSARRAAAERRGEEWRGKDTSARSSEGARCGPPGVCCPVRAGAEVGVGVDYTHNATGEARARTGRRSIAHSCKAGRGREREGGRAIGPQGHVILSPERGCTPGIRCGSPRLGPWAAAKPPCCAAGPASQLHGAGWDRPGAHRPTSPRVVGPWSEIPRPMGPRAATLVANSEAAPR